MPILIALVLTLIVFSFGRGVAQEDTENAAETMRQEVATRNPLVFVRGTRQYRFIASLFPLTGDRFDPERDNVMTPEQQENAKTYLNVQFETQKWALTKETGSVLRALEGLGVLPVILTAVAPAELIFVDDQGPWANTVPPTQIKLGARILRGLVLGSLSESITGQEWASKRLAAFLGADPKSGRAAEDVELRILESRTRLFIAAIERGSLLQKDRASFDNYVASDLALMRRYLEAKENSNTFYTDLENRLRMAAHGGPISAADGQIMYEVFQDLSRHVEAAITFILSHELGHVVLGHGDFRSTLSCDEKRKREDDADAFAMAMLVYDSPGESEAADLALSRMDMKKMGTNRLDYGYAHAIRYGLGWAGSSNMLGPDCNYRNTDDRIAFMDNLRQKVVLRRSEAIERIYRLFNSYPPYVYTQEDVDELLPSRRKAQAYALFALCGAGDAPREVQFKKLREFPFGWVVQCPNELPSEFTSPAFQALLGVQTWKDVQEDYRSHIPFSSLLIAHPAVLPLP